MSFWNHSVRTSLLSNSETFSWFEDQNKSEIVIVFVDDQVIPVRKSDLSMKDYERIKQEDNAELVETNGEAVVEALASLKGGDEQ